MRLFVALDIDEYIRQRITSFVGEVSRAVPEVRFVGPQTYHITLKFIGETGKFEQIREALGTVKAKPIQVNIREVGFFPDARQPRVFWAGIHADSSLAQLSKDVNKSLVPLGFAVEDKPFHPHLTLARSGSGNPHSSRAGKGLGRLAQFVSTIEPPEFGTMTAHEFYLYESKLLPRGAQYTRRECYSLV